MNLFNRKDKTQNAQMEQSAEYHAPAPAPDAQNLMGGLAWYRNNFHHAMKLLLIMVIALCVALGIITYLLLNQPKPQYFAATPDLRLAPLVPLDKPVLSQQGLLNWVSETITDAMSLDFLDWRKKLEAIRQNFDEDAYKSFLESMQSSGVLKMIQEKRLSASAIVTKAPVIIASGVIGNIATWRVEFPIIVSYESSQGVESTQHLMATVLVRRSDTVKSPRGVVIQQIVLNRES